MIILKPFRGHQLRSVICEKSGSKGWCKNCGVTVYSRRQEYNNMYFSYSYELSNSPYSNDLSLIPTCKEITEAKNMNEALR